MTRHRYAGYTSPIQRLTLLTQSAVDETRIPTSHSSNRVSARRRRPGQTRGSVPIMPSTYTTPDIRNVTIAGHAGSGKTILAERILELTKTIGRMGSIEEKNTVCDFEPEEKEHGHTLASAIVHIDHQASESTSLTRPGTAASSASRSPLLRRRKRL